jgi:hypothetical protein
VIPPPEPRATHEMPSHAEDHPPARSPFLGVALSLSLMRRLIEHCDTAPLPHAAARQQASRVCYDRGVPERP